MQRWRHVSNVAMLRQQHQQQWSIVQTQDRVAEGASAEGMIAAEGLEAKLLVYN